MVVVTAATNRQKTTGRQGSRQAVWTPKGAGERRDQTRKYDDKEEKERRETKTERERGRKEGNVNTHSRLTKTLHAKTIWVLYQQEVLFSMHAAGIGIRHTQLV